jgi:hypothetical protein
MFDFINNIHFTDALKYSIELVMFIIIFREIRELKKHSKALERHEDKLESVRPLFTNLYTDSKDILNLAIQFTQDANELKAIGTLSILSITETHPSKSEEDTAVAIKELPAEKINYVNSTLDYIQSGRAYYRVMNLLPISKNEADIWELWANIKFFKRIFETQKTKPINLHLFHHPTLISSQEDFHYRCSDKAVIIRAGGNFNPSSNSAISITDSRVVEKYKSAYDDLIKTNKCKNLDLEILQKLDKYYSRKDFQNVKLILSDKDEI